MPQQWRKMMPCESTGRQGPTAARCGRKAGAGASHLGGVAQQPMQCRGLRRVLSNTASATSAFRFGLLPPCPAGRAVAMQCATAQLHAALSSTEPCSAARSAMHLMVHVSPPCRFSRHSSPFSWATGCCCGTSSPVIFPCTVSVATADEPTKLAQTQQERRSNATSRTLCAKWQSMQCHRRGMPHLDPVEPVANVARMAMTS